MLREKFRAHAASPDRPVPSGSPDDIKSSYEELTLGVWRVLVMKDSPFSVFNFQWDILSETFLLLHRALCDVYSISPRLFALYIMAHVWFAIEEPLSLYFSNRLFLFVSKVERLISALTGWCH